MKIISIHILAYQTNQQTKFLASEYQLSFAWWHQRPFIKQTLNFGVRTAVKLFSFISRSKVNQKTIIDMPQSKAKCFLWIDNQKIAFVIITDDQYPQRVAFTLLLKLKNQFYEKVQIDSIKTIQQNNLKLQGMQTILTKYQDPKQVDKLQKLKHSLKQIQEVCHKNLQQLLQRNQTLQQLMNKSKDMSSLSLDFYKTAKKANTKCCSLY